MEVLYCGHATGQKEKRSAKYLQCTKIDVGSLQSLTSKLLYLMGTINRPKMLHTKI